MTRESSDDAVVNGATAVLPWHDPELTGGGLIDGVL
jgi:hypothetical protein